MIGHVAFKSPLPCCQRREEAPSILSEIFVRPSAHLVVGMPFSDLEHRESTYQTDLEAYGLALSMRPAKSYEHHL